MPSEIKDKTFEEALKELEDIVKQFELGKFTLEEAIAAYEKGLALKQHCLSKLQQAKTKIDIVTKEGMKELEEEPAT
jgi:exodeoxyribonuclease VII small subunit